VGVSEKKKTPPTKILSEAVINIAVPL